MSMRETLARFWPFGGADSGEAVTLREAAGVTIDDDEGNWRALTGDRNRDLSPITQERMRDLGAYLWESNLLARQLIELPVAYLLAEGVKLTVADEDAQGWLDAFWNDPINSMDIKLPKKVREFKLFGEQCWPVFVNEISGHVRLGYLDPSLIETVVTDPENIEQPIGVVTRKNTRGVARRYRVIVNGPETVFSERTREIRTSFEDGDCFFFTKNDLSSGKRGRSDLLGSIDWLDAYEQFMFGEIDRASFLRAFIWDVTLKGATAEEVAARAREITTPAPASARVHNDQEVWEALAPDLKAADNSEAARLFRNHILGGHTLPEHWFGGGGDVNRSTAGEMGEPTFKVLSMEQRLWKHMLEEVAKFVIMRRLDPSGGSAFDPEDVDPDLQPSAEFPEMTTRDTTKYAAALQQVVAAAAISIERGLMTELTALRLVQSIAERLGIEFDADEELAAARAEAGKRAEDDAFVTPPEDPDDGDEDAGRQDNA